MKISDVVFSMTLVIGFLAGVIACVVIAHETIAIHKDVHEMRLENINGHHNEN